MTVRLSGSDSNRFAKPFTILMNNDPEYELIIFTEALKLPAHERMAFLERKCGTDKNLRRRLEDLIRAHDRLGNFLEEPPTGGGWSENN